MNFKTFRQLLSVKKKSCDYAFITTRAVKDEHSPYFHPEYDANHPILHSSEVKDGCWADEYLIINPHQCPIDWASGSRWFLRFERNDLECLLIIERDELYKLYSKEQADDLIAFIGNQCVRYTRGEEKWMDVE